MLVIEELSRKHNRRGFDCGDDSLNHFLDKTAMQHCDKGVSKTYVLVDEQNPTLVLGFYTLNPCSIDVSNLPEAVGKRLPNHVFGGKVGRLAVSKEFQKQGLGTKLLISALEQYVGAAEKIGMVALFVDAKNQAVADQFYKKFGFKQCSDNPLHLFLTTQDIKAAFE